MKLEKLQKTLFYVALTIELLIMLIDKSALTNPIEGRLFQITFLLFAIKVCITQYTGREWIVIVLFELLGLVSYEITGRNEIIRIVTLIAACKDINMKQIFHYMFRMILAGCLILIVLSLTGILGAIKITDVFRGGMAETRYCLGLGHPNALHCMFFMLVLLGLYLYAERMKMYHYMVLFFSNIALFVLTGSKTGALAVFIALFFTITVRYFRKLQQSPLLYILTELELAFCVFVAWWAAKISYLIAYRPDLKYYDRFLSGRVTNLYYGSESHAGALSTWTLWGVPENEYYFDLGWVRLFYWYGIIPAMIYIIILSLLIWQLYKDKNIYGIMIIASLFIYSLFEAHTVSVYLTRDYTLFLIGGCWSKMFRSDQGKEGFVWDIFKIISKKDR